MSAATAIPQSNGAQTQFHADSSSPPSSTSISWEGDKMFNIYIYDYCNKRGFSKTARELLVEADIPQDSTPPINARQGLLFEWWSVFWVLFSARSNGNGTEDAMLYTQHQVNQSNQRQARLQQQQPQPSLGQPPQPMGRLMNGAIPRLPQSGFLPNGIAPPQQSSPLPPGSGVPGPSYSMTGIIGSGAAGASQPNGLVNHQPGHPSMGGIGPPQPPNLQPQSQPQPSFNNHMFPPSRRESLGPPNPRLNGVPPFQSPTVAHSSAHPQHQNQPPSQQNQHPGQPPQQQQPQPQQHLQQQPPMGQLGPSPHMMPMSRGGMPPPNTPGQPGQQQPPTPTTSAFGGPPSRTTTPGQGHPSQGQGNAGGMMNPSPSLAARQVPGGGMQMMPPNSVDQEFSRIPSVVLPNLKGELGMHDKETSTLSSEDKNRIIATYKNRNPNQRGVKPGPPGANNAVAGPSMPQQRLPGQQPPPMRPVKRGSTSPGQEPGGSPRNDTSPPASKRIRRSPMGSESNPLTPMAGHAYPPTQASPQQHTGMPPHQQPGPHMQMSQPQMRGNLPGNMINGFPPQAGMMPIGGATHMMSGGNTMSPGIPGHPHSMMSQGMSPQYQYQRMQPSMQHKGNIPPGINNPSIPGNPSSNNDPNSFNPSANNNNTNTNNGSGPPPMGTSHGPPAYNLPNRMTQKPMGPIGMMPPPSPSMNGPPKDGKDVSNKPPGGMSGANPQDPISSPRNLPNQGPANAIPVGPVSTVPSTTTPNPSGSGTPVPNNPGNNALTAPSPSAAMGGLNQTPSQAPPPSVTDPITVGLFTNEFIESVAGSLDEFDPTTFRPDGDINFERDFGQWFNPDDAMGSLNL